MVTAKSTPATVIIYTLLKSRCKTADGRYCPYLDSCGVCPLFDKVIFEGARWLIDDPDARRPAICRREITNNTITVTYE